MEVKSRRRYSREYKEDVVNMLRTGDKNVPALSKELGICEQVLYRWNKKFNGKKGTSQEKVSDQEKEVRELRKKLADVTEERDILKKAVHIFSRQSGSK